MKKYLFVILLLTVSLLNSFAQTSIWKISKNNSTLYLGGSVHVLSADDYPLPKEFDAVFYRADKVIFETDISKLKDPQTVQSMRVKGMYTGNKTLKDVLSKEVYKKLKHELSKLSLRINKLKKFKPSVVITTMQLVKLKKSGVSSEKGVDQYYYSKSKEENKELSFLETINEQIDIITSLGEGNENKYVKNSLENFDKIGISGTVSDWKDGTSKVMMREINEMRDNFPEMYNSLLVQRNNNWIPKIENCLNDNKIEFIIAGNLHLHGPDGLLKILEDKGYQVEQYLM